MERQRLDMVMIDQCLKHPRGDGVTAAGRTKRALHEENAHVRR